MITECNGEKFGFGCDESTGAIGMRLEMNVRINGEIYAMTLNDVPEGRYMTVEKGGTLFETGERIDLP